DPAKKSDLKIEEGTWNGQKYWAIPRFHVFYRIGSGTAQPSEGPLALQTIGPKLERAAEMSVKQMEPVLGRVHLPTVRLYLCDPVQFQAKTSEGVFAGITSQNEITLKVDAGAQWLPEVLLHEYIHMVHLSVFPNQPRWLSEGIAMSFSAPDKGGRPRV